ncbi:MAG: hemerythrin domain-containing protein [Candidatus Nitricoxidivorans perseverans]|uniref:Hemerythrin domain-containing protein n=1 Tax=Candidatus Nitricoxidivorans perseverans TaxID=2975601 RepID=A0AA49IYG1_9PROT|nr:MAG: hemerythrin domain-containing protein [Candidatus Nitricoxidivorans perseverans]
MPNRAQWNSDYLVGNETLDNQHRDILAQCDALADCASGSGREVDLKFQESLDELMTRAHKHYSTEEELLARFGCRMLEEHKNERDEFEYLAANIITTENFDKTELQRFLILWWTGHVADSGRHRSFMEKSPPAE